jgi:hypothetical protein
MTTTSVVPSRALSAAAQALRLTQAASSGVEPQPWDNLPEPRQQYWLGQARTVLEAGLRALDPTLLDPHHMLRVEDGRWGLQHPLACRPKLTACPVHVQIVNRWDTELSWLPAGEHLVYLHADGCITATPEGHRHHRGDGREPADPARLVAYPGIG